MFCRLFGWYTIYTFSKALAPKRNSARCRIHFVSKSYILLFWQRYCTALEQWASAKLCGMVQGMELWNICSSPSSTEGASYIPRAAITLGIGPHSRFHIFQSALSFLYCVCPWYWDSCTVCNRSYHPLNKRCLAITWRPHDTLKLVEVLSAQLYKLEMWASAQRDGRPAEYRWRPLFSAAKFGWRPLLECCAVTLSRRETRWNLQGCRKLPDWSQPLVGRSTPYCGDIWRRYCCLTIFFRLSICALVAKI